MTSFLEAGSESLKDFWTYIIALMKTKWINSVALADSLQVPVTTLKSWIQRNSFPNWTVEEICTILGITPETLQIQRFHYKIARPYRSTIEPNINHNTLSTSSLWLELSSLIGRLAWWVWSNCIRLLWGTGTGKSSLIQRWWAFATLSYNPNDSSEPLEQFAEWFSRTVRQPLQIKTYSALTMTVLNRLWNLNWIVFDGIYLWSHRWNSMTCHTLYRYSWTISDMRSYRATCTLKKLPYSDTTI